MLTEEPLLLRVPRDEVFVSVRGIATITKDPAAKRYYGVDLTDWLEEVGEALEGAAVVLDGIDAADPDTSGGPTVVFLPDDTTGRQKIAVKLSGGTDNALATFTFWTTGGATDRRRIRFLIRER